METEYEYGDLLYFGYPYDEDSEKHQNEFIAEVKQRFPLVKLWDAYDEIKGYRQEVRIPKGEKENFMIWLIAFGWFDFGLTTQILMMSEDKESKDLLRHYIDLAKEQYPEKFKKQ